MEAAPRREPSGRSGVFIPAWRSGRKLGLTPPTTKLKEAERVLGGEVEVPVPFFHSEGKGIYREAYCSLMCPLARGRLVASDIAIDVAWRTEMSKGMGEGRLSSSSTSVKRTRSSNDEVVV